MTDFYCPILRLTRAGSETRVDVATRWRKEVSVLNMT